MHEIVNTGPQQAPSIQHGHVGEQWPRVPVGGDYTDMAPYYDAIMLVEYCDYVAIAEALAACEGGSMLELGVGTGLILERLAIRRPEVQLVGVDLTPAMLDLAADQLHRHPHIGLVRQDVVTLNLGQRFDLIFSFGGPFYFARQDDGALTLISHIPGQPANEQALERVADHLPAGGTLLLGVQGPHLDYSAPIGRGLVYSQTIESTGVGFRKHYCLTQDGGAVMRHVADYRTWEFSDALRLMERCGLEYVPEPAPGGGSGAAEPLFLGFRRRG